MKEYTLQFDTHAGRELSKLPQDVARRIFKKLQESKQNPRHYWERLDGRRDYKMRVGDYRVIADIYEDQKLIYVTKIGHRKTIYEEC